MERWSEKWFALGLGVGLVMTGLVSGLSERKVSDRVIIQRARELGMVYREELVSYADSRPGKIRLAIAPGLTVDQVAGILVSAGLSEDRQQLLGLIREQGNQVIAGIYEFDPSEDSLTVTRKICSGEVVAKLE